MKRRVTSRASLRKRRFIFLLEFPATAVTILRDDWNGEGNFHGRILTAENRVERRTDVGSKSGAFILIP